MPECTCEYGPHPTTGVHGRFPNLSCPEHGLGDPTSDAAADRVAAMQLRGERPMQWTKEPPKDPNFYWAWSSGDGDPTLGELYLASMVLIGRVIPDRPTWYFRTIEGEEYEATAFDYWLGPIPVPAPPEP